MLTSPTRATTSSVPAHTGGADLSWDDDAQVASEIVPAHTGGADLSVFAMFADFVRSRPRPHGRGGFKSVLFVC